jgi:hypothetical protein
MNVKSYQGVKAAVTIERNFTFAAIMGLKHLDGCCAVNRVSAQKMA